MSTGAWHYAAAERLLREGDDAPFIQQPVYVGAAQVHATLALAAATALRDGDSLPERDWQAWDDAAGTRKAPS